MIGNVSIIGMLVAAAAVYWGLRSLWMGLRSDVSQFPRKGQQLPLFVWFVLPLFVCWTAWKHAQTLGLTWVEFTTAGLALAVVGVLILLGRRQWWLRRQAQG